MAGDYYGTSAFDNESDTESMKDWFMEPQAWPCAPEAPALHRKAKVLGGDRNGNNHRLRRVPRYQGYQRHAPPDARMAQPLSIKTHQSPITKRRTLEAQLPGQYMVPPPRNPARLLAKQTSRKAPSTMQSPTSTPKRGDSTHPHSHGIRHQRCSSNVNGHTVSLLAANVIFTTNKVFSAMVHHANTGNTSNPSSNSEPTSGDNSIYNPTSFSNHHRRNPTSSSLPTVTLDLPSTTTKSQEVEQAQEV